MLRTALISVSLFGSLTAVSGREPDLGSATSQSQAATTAYRSKAARNRAAFYAFARLYYRERRIREAFERFVAPDYIQHNPGIADGREAAIAWLERMTARAEVTMDLRHVLVDGDYAVVHLIGRQGPADPGHAIMNVFRMHNGIIVEHWDVTQPIPSATASGRPIG